MNIKDIVTHKMGNKDHEGRHLVTVDSSMTV